MVEKRLTKEIAELYCGVACTNYSSLFLSSFRELGIDNPSIQMREFTRLDPAAAETLIDFEQSLYLDGLTSLTDQTAYFLRKHKKGGVSLNGLMSLSDKVAEYLGKYAGSSLGLNGLTSLSDKAAECLGNYVGSSLGLNGLTSLSDMAANDLREYNGSLSLQGLFTGIVQRVLNAPIDEQETESGALRLIVGDPAEVIVTIDDCTIEVAVFGVRWTGSHTSEIHPRSVGVLHWADFEHVQFEQLLTTLLQAAQNARRAGLGQCRYCGRLLGPEHMHGDMCHGCAERHEGIVH